MAYGVVARWMGVVHYLMGIDSRCGAQKSQVVGVTCKIKWSNIKFSRNQFIQCNLECHKWVTTSKVIISVHFGINLAKCITRSPNLSYLKGWSQTQTNSDPILRQIGVRGGNICCFFLRGLLEKCTSLLRIKTKMTGSKPQTDSDGTQNDPI